MPIQPLVPFNSLFVNDQDDLQRFPIPRELPSGQIDVAKPEQLPAPKASESAEASMDPDDVLTVTEIPAEETRSDQKQLAQTQGEQTNRETGGDRVDPKYAERERKRHEIDDSVEVDAHGPVFVGPASERQFVQYGPSKVGGQLLRAAGSEVVSSANEMMGPSLQASKQEIMDVLPSNPFDGISTGLIQQMNTMLIILGLAYVAGQAVGAK